MLATQCHCRTSTESGVDLDPRTATSGTEQEPPEVSDYLRLHPLYRMYYCDYCHCLRCPSCVQEEIVSFYCPNCLFEVPSASVKAEKNRCARNCFECPICSNTLNVVSVVDPAASSATSAIATASPPATPILSSATMASSRLAGATPGSPQPLAAAALPAGGIHYLSCGVCRWDSLEIGLKFDRPTGLA
ncbi:hypothetical protein HK405_015257, partial [Cladochytrium tenue]